MPRTVRTTSTLQVCALMLLAAAAAVLIGLGVKQILDGRRAVYHTREVLSRLAKVQAGSLESEAGARRYALTGEPADAAQAVAMDTEDSQLLRELAQLVNDNPAQLEDVERLVKVCAESAAMHADLIAERDRFGDDLARIRDTVAPERRIASERVEIIRRMEGREEALLRHRHATFQRTIQLFGVSLAGAWALTLVVLLAGNRVINRVNAARQRADEALRLINEDLEARVRERTAELERTATSLGESERRYRDLVEAAPEGVLVERDGVIIYSNLTGARMLGGRACEDLIGRPTASLVAPAWRQQAADRVRTILEGQGAIISQEGTWLRLDGTEIAVEVSATRGTMDGKACVQTLVRDVTERRAARAEISRINAELEDRVRVRTAELQAANEEMEAFCYSVSHDLRAPLRAIDGFSRMVVSEHAGALGAEGTRLLGVVRANTVRMGELIDDLLSFSRLSRQSTTSVVIDTNAMVRDIVESLRAGENGRIIDFQIGDLPCCKGDIAMLRQVWTNLVLNALKFTRHRSAAKIEIGGASENGEVTFHVCDNGVGFDMQYADKLFGVFQRFHRREEFEGTGVGLAIVKRVVERHAGRVWAHAAVDAGATFWFALPGVDDGIGRD